MKQQSTAEITLERPESRDTTASMPSEAPMVDFFCIGVGNSGSSWLATCLNEHPEITISKVKEPNFFVRKMSVFGAEENPWFMKSWKWYASQFNHAREDNLLGDMSINLIHNIPEAPTLVHRYYPDAKLIVILRNPTYRIYSQYWHEKRYRRISSIPDSFEAAIANDEFLSRSKYYEFLRYWREVFDKQRFFILLDFDIKADPFDILQKLYGFLGVDREFHPPSLEEVKNVASWGHPTYAALYRIVKWLRFSGFEGLVSLLRTLRINKFMRGLLVKPVPYPEMTLDLKTKLRDYYLSDIEKLEELIGRDLTPWKQLAVNQSE